MSVMLYIQSVGNIVNIYTINMYIKSYYIILRMI